MIWRRLSRFAKSAVGGPDGGCRGRSVGVDPSESSRTAASEEAVASSGPIGPAAGLSVSCGKAASECGGAERPAKAGRPVSSVGGSSVDGVRTGPPTAATIGGEANGSSSPFAETGIAAVAAPSDRDSSAGPTPTAVTGSFGRSIGNPSARDLSVEDSSVEEPSAEEPLVEDRSAGGAPRSADTRSGAVTPDGSKLVVAPVGDTTVVSSLPRGGPTVGRAVGSGSATTGG